MDVKIYFDNQNSSFDNISKIREALNLLSEISPEEFFVTKHFLRR